MSDDNGSELGSWNTWARKVVTELADLKKESKEMRDKLVSIELSLSNFKTQQKTRQNIYGAVWGVVIVVISLLINLFVK